MDVPRAISRRSVLASGLKVGAGLMFPSLFPRCAHEETRSTDLLIIGAGPFGLALAAYAQELGLSHLMVGSPMEFWRSNMPTGMYLRSTCDWSLDPLDIHSIDAFLSETGRRCRDVEPLSRDFYLDYAGWFRTSKALRSVDAGITSLATEDGGLVATTASGQRIRSRSVVLAIGFGYFANVPADLAAMFPSDRYEHTVNLVDFGELRGRRVLIIGGRQSAFEWTALIRESGADAVHVCYRHDTPRFEASDWAWVSDIVDNLAEDPGWYRRLDQEQRARLNQRFWEEGRLKLEPWLAPRIDYPNVHRHPHTRVVGADASDAGIEVALDRGDMVTVDDVVFATGYAVDLSRVPLLVNGLLSELRVRDGFPVLDEHFATNVPGLYVTSLAATRDFGAFLAFTVSVRAQAKIIVRDILDRYGAGVGPSLGKRHHA